MAQKASLSSVFKICFPNGLVVRAGASFRQETETLRRKILESAPGAQVGNAELIERNLMRFVLWEQLDNDFSQGSDEVYLSCGHAPLVLSQELTKTDLADRFYKRGDVVPLDDIRRTMLDFVRACRASRDTKGESLTPFGEIAFPMFFAKGPFADLSFSGSPEEGCVSFPGLNIPKGKTVFIMPRRDNLVLWHFSVVDRDERPIATFAFDEKTEQSFSPYDYGAEEARKFLCYNPLFKEKDNPILDLLHKFVIDYQRETVFKQGKKIFFPRLSFPIRGPLRRLRFFVEKIDPAAKNEQQGSIISIDPLFLCEGEEDDCQTGLDVMPAWLEDKFEGLDLSAEEMQRIKTTLRNNGITDDQDRLAEGFIDGLNKGFTSLGFSAAVVERLVSLKIHIAPTIKVKKIGKGHRWGKYFFTPEFGGFFLTSFQRFDKQGRMTIPEKWLMHAKSPESSYGTPWYFKKETSGWQVVFEGTGSG